MSAYFSRSALRRLPSSTKTGLLRWRAIRAVICFSISFGRDVLALAEHQILDRLGIQHDRLRALRDLDLDVLVDQVDGLGAEGVPHKPAGDVGGPDRLVDVGEPAVVVAIRREHRVGAERLPQLGDDAVRQAEGVLRCVVGDRRLCLDEALVAADRSVDAGEERQRSGDGRLELVLEFLDVGDDLLDRLLVERQRLGDVVEDAEVVDDQPMGLVGRIDAVGAGDRLQQRVLLQRLVEVLAVQDRRIEAGEQLRRDDDDLQRVGGVVEPRDDLLQLVSVPESTSPSQVGRRGTSTSRSSRPRRPGACRAPPYTPHTRPCRRRRPEP